MNLRCYSTLAATPSCCLLFRRPPGVVNELYLLVSSLLTSTLVVMCVQREAPKVGNVPSRLFVGQRELSK